VLNLVEFLRARVNTATQEAVRPIVRPPKYAPAPCKWWLADLPIPNGWSSVTALRWPDLSKWGHESSMSWASMPIVNLLRPSILELRSGTVQTDGQTTAINA